jgi:ABC-type sugar transport system permease subunit
MAAVRGRNDTLYAYLFLAPFLLAFVVFLGWPIVYSLWLSFHKTSVFTDWYNIFGDMEWAGLDN